MTGGDELNIDDSMVSIDFTNVESSKLFVDISDVIVTGGVGVG